MKIIVTIMLGAIACFGDSGIVLEHALQQGINDLDCEVLETNNIAYGHSSRMTAEQFSELKEGALAGDPIKLKNIAFLCSIGSGVEQDEALAYRIMLKLARLGDVDAIRFVGACYQQGKGGVAKSYSEALKWYEKGVEGGSAFSARSIANLYITGDASLPVDEIKSEEWFEKYESMVLSQRKPATIYYLGMDYYRKADTIIKSAQLFELSADMGHFPSMLRLVRIYVNGEGIEPNRDLAHKWLNVAIAARGEEEVLESYSKMYSVNERDRLIQDLRLEFELISEVPDVEFDELSAKALAGDLESKKALASWYFSGERVYKDMCKALKLYEEAAVMGDAHSMHKVGSMYRIGLGKIPRDIKKAEFWYEQAIKQGVINSSLSLCEIYYREGTDSSTNMGKAKEIEKAMEARYADKASVIQLYRLGIYYQLGTFRSVEYQKSFSYFQRAADQGHSPSMVYLAKAY